MRRHSSSAGPVGRQLPARAPTSSARALQIAEPAAALRAGGPDELPGNHDRAWFIAPLLFRNERYEEALQQYEIAEGQANTTWANVFKVMTYHGQGRPEAKELWEQVRSEWERAPGTAPGLRLIYFVCEKLMEGSD